MAVTTRASLWAQRVARMEACGQSCKEYAQRIGVNPNTLAGWRWKLRRAGSPPTTETDAPQTAKQADEPHLVEVTQQLAATLAQEVGVIELEIRGGLVRVRGPVDADVLATVLGVLEGRR